MKRKTNSSALILTVFLCLTVFFQMPVQAQVVIEVSVPIHIEVNVTTHPDTYETQLPLKMTSPYAADLDADDIPDIICAGYNKSAGVSSVYVWNRKGDIRNGWPVEVSGKIEAAPAAADIDGDGLLEVITAVSNTDGKGGRVYAWRCDGSLSQGYPVNLDYYPGPPACGDTEGGFEEEVFAYEQNMGITICDIDSDGKKEVIITSPFGITAVDRGDMTPVGWPVKLVDIGSPVSGDIDADGKPEIFIAVKTQDANYIYGWHSDGTVIPGWPVNIAGVINAPGDFLALADIDGDNVSEIISGSSNGWLCAWKSSGSVLFSTRPPVSEGGDAETNSVYQPVIGDINNDGDMEILASSRYGSIYCYDHTGNPVNGWPYTINNYELSQGVVLLDIDSGAIADEINPANDLELMFSASDGKVHVIDLPGDFLPNHIQWGMHGFNARNVNNYLRDWDTKGWFVFDDKPDGAVIDSVYDWNRTSRVISLKGAGLNNAYVFEKPDGMPLNSKNTALQWSMRYHLPFNIYVSVDTLKGKRFLHYTALPDDTSPYINYALGDTAENGKWHTYRRDLAADLKTAEPDNGIVDVNAVYIQGSGLVDDIMLLPGLPAYNIANLALTAQVSVSSGDALKGFINDGDAGTKWVSDNTDISWVEYAWEDPQKVNKIVITGAEGAKSGVVFITDSSGNVYEVTFDLPEDGGSIELVFDAIPDVKTIVVVFDNDNSPVSAGEIGVYYDPNAEKDTPLPEEPYSADNYIQIKNGYFFDPVLGKAWIPHGIAYQTWNKALGQWQSPAELKKDLDGIKGAGADAVRVDFVWKHIETSDNVFKWSNYDMLLEEAQARGLKVFPIIGYQWPPDWFPEEWYTMHPACETHPGGPWLSDILSYEDPDARAQFADFLQAVVSRYSEGGAREDLGDTIAGWVLGNEFGYLGLWSVEYDGYDPDCQGAFREWLSKKYADINSLNAKWAQDNVKTPGYLPGWPYNDFSEVDMPIPFGYAGDISGKYIARDKASWYDLTEWREDSIAGFAAFAASSVRSADQYHLITYAAVGMQWGEEDWRYHTEDARKIAERCAEENAPLDFWSINNYPWGMQNNELMTGQWGIERARHDTGLPVMVTETGFTSTETMYPGIDADRQAKLVRNAVWEALESGAIGVCVFHWNDRKQTGLSKREEGFGIVDINKNPKPAYSAVKNTFNKMDEIGIAKYLAGSKGPSKDIAFLWDAAVDTIVNRYEAEMNALFGTLERLGFEPTFINDEEMSAGMYTLYKAIVLPRNQKMKDSIFDMLDDVKAAGVYIHADADIPGIMDEYGNSRAGDINWQTDINSLFGIDTAGISLDPNLEDNVYFDYYETGSFSLDYTPERLVYPSIGFDKTINMWKFRDKSSVDGGIVKAVFGRGTPALVFHFGTAVSLFSLGDNKPIDNIAYGAEDWTWSDRYDWIRSIYMGQDGFGLQPELNVSNRYILADYRLCSSGAVLISLKNYRPDKEETVDISTPIVTGKAVKDLLTDEIIEDPSDGVIERTLEPDGHDLVLAYASAEDSQDMSGDGEDNGQNSHGKDQQTGQDSQSAGDTSTEASSGSSSVSPSSGSTSDSSNSGSSSGNNTGSSGGTSNTSGSSSSGVTQPQASPDSSVSKDNSASVTNNNNDYGSVIILDKEKKDTNNEIPNSQGDSSYSAGSAGKRSPYKRTYIGNNTAGQAGEKDADAYESKDIRIKEQIIEQLPPIEQFRRVIETAGQKGVIRVKPQIVSPAKLDEILNAPQKKLPRNLPAMDFAAIINNWIEKFKSWWKDLTETIRMAGTLISKRYA